MSAAPLAWCVPLASRGRFLRRGLLDATVELYVNDPPPDDANSLLDYTPAQGPGYTRAFVRALGWTTSGDVIRPREPVPFTFTGPLANAPAIVGYFVRDVFSGELAWSERLFGGPQVVDGPGRLIVVPRLRLVPVVVVVPDPSEEPFARWRSS